MGEDPSPLIDEFDSTWRSAKEITAAEAFQPGLPLRKRERRRVRWTAFLAVLVLAVLGFAGYKFVSGVGRDRHPSAAASPRPSGPGAHSQPAVGQHPGRPGQHGPVFPGHHSVGEYHSVGESRSGPGSRPRPPWRHSARRERPMATIPSWRRSPSAGTRPALV